MKIRQFSNLLFSARETRPPFIVLSSSWSSFAHFVDGFRRQPSSGVGENYRMTDSFDLFLTLSIGLWKAAVWASSHISAQCKTWKGKKTTLKLCSGVGSTSSMGLAQSMINRGNTLREREPIGSELCLKVSRQFEIICTYTYVTSRINTMGKHNTDGTGGGLLNKTNPRDGRNFPFLLSKLMSTLLYFDTFFVLETRLSVCVWRVDDIKEMKVCATETLQNQSASLPQAPFPHFNCSASTRLKSVP